MGDAARIRHVAQPSVGRKAQEILVDTFLGLDTTTPYTALKSGQSPYFQNCRLYARNSTDRRVAVGTRKGPGFYTVPAGETADVTLTSTTGSSNQSATTTTWLAQIFTPSISGRLTKIDINVKTGTTPTQHLLVAIYSSSGGAPSTLLATSSILSSNISNTYSYLSARFVEAPTVAASTSYWIVVYMQMGGSGDYNWSSTTSATTAKVSNSSGGAWSATSYALNYKAYVSTGTKQLGSGRYNPTSGTNKTLMAHGTSMYTVNDVTGALTAITTGLSASASKYYFAQSDDKIFWTNGYDLPKYYDGTTVSSVTAAAVNSKFVIFHKNRAFFVDPNNPTKVIFSDLGDYATYTSTNFFYVPSPKSGDPVTGWTVFQDNLTIFTRKTKYVLYGDDPGNFVLRQSSGKKGAVNQDVIKADANYVYFLADDGVYRYNGSQDQLISDKVQTLVDRISDKTLASAAIHNNYYRLYYPDFGSTVINTALLWDTINNFFLFDTETYIDYPIVLEDNTLIEGSSLTGSLYYAEDAYSDLGKPINFKYWTKYFGDGLHKIFLRRVIPSLRLQTQPYDLNVYIDIDQRNTASIRYTVNAQASGITWGDGSSWAGSSSTVWGSAVVSTPETLQGTEAYWHQIRFEQTGVDTPVEILSYILEERTRRTR
jgi:hypothetical protein